MLLRGSGRGRDIILTRGSISDGQEAGSLLVGNCFQPYIRKGIFKNVFFSCSIPNYIQPLQQVLIKLVYLPTEEL